MRTPTSILVILVCGQLLSGCYATRQLYQQGLRLASRENISDVLLDPTTDESTRRGLKHLEEILFFAKGQGLNVEQAYTTIVQIGDEAVSYIVQASFADRLEAVTWWFPFIGDVPYLGFVDIAERDQKAEQLAALGYDILLGQAAAYSSLGWFEDPIFSPMLRRSIEHLADLIFHELIHRTLWIPGSSKFNEQLASYGAFLLTQKFLKESNRKSALIRYLSWHRDRQKFRVWLLALRQALENIYSNKVLLHDEVLVQKRQIFSDFVEKKRPHFERVDFVDGRSWNNATVVGASLYSPGRQQFDQAFACAGKESVGDFLQKIKLLEGDIRSSQQLQQMLCEQAAKPTR